MDEQNMNQQPDVEATQASAATEQQATPQPEQQAYDQQMYQQQMYQQQMYQQQMYQQQMYQQQMYQQQMYQQQAYGQPMNQKKGVNISESFKKIGGFFLNPVDTAKELSDAKNMVPGGICILGHALITAFVYAVFALIMGFKVTGVPQILSTLGLFVFIILMDAMILGFTLLFGKVAFKGEMNLAGALSVTGIFAIYQLVANVIGLGAAFLAGLSDLKFFMYIAWFFFVAISILGIGVAVTAASDTANISGNFKGLAIGLILVCSFLGCKAVDYVGGTVCTSINEDYTVSVASTYNYVKYTRAIHKCNTNARSTYKNYKKYYDNYSDFLKNGIYSSWYWFIED